MEKVFGEVHYYDCKGRQYRLDHLHNEIEQMDIEVNGTSFNDDYDGYVEVMVTLEQAIELSKKYKRFVLPIGKGNTIEEQFNDALRIERMVNKTRKG
jgi:hypothetical protein